MSSQDKKEGFETIGSSDDLKAWEREIATIKKLKKDKIYLKQNEMENGNRKKIKTTKKESPEERGLRNKGAAKVNITAKSSFQTDAGTDRKLKQGRLKIDASIDLHGKTKFEAFRLLAEFIAAAYEDGCKCVLIITGKGSGPAENKKSPGVLKQIVPEWLGQPSFQQYVLKTTPAKPKHGGQGAIYVLLRKKRKN